MTVLSSSNLILTLRGQLTLITYGCDVPPQVVWALHLGPCMRTSEQRPGGRKWGVTYTVTYSRLAHEKLYPKQGSCGAHAVVSYLWTSARSWMNNFGHTVDDLLSERHGTHKGCSSSLICRWAPLSTRVYSALHWWP